MKTNNDQLWQSVLNEIELNLSKANFATWFKNTFISSYEGDKIIIGVPSGFVRSWMENKFHKEIISTLENILNAKISEVVYKIETRKTNNATNFLKKSLQTSSQTETTQQNEKPEPSVNKNRFGLNGRYNFNNFVKGSGNELAHAACQAVIQKPGKAYNPLFIYGGVGLGKTHLIQSIGNELVKKEKKVLYATSEQFTNDYIYMVKTGEAKKFKNMYRGVDVFLVDDVQFMGGKDGTQQEFFHTFNELYQSDKQVVITSDRHPKSIPGLEKRLLSRFESGMVADIVQPDVETKAAILETKCEEKKYSLENKIIDYVASNIQGNIRELEGALNRLIAYHEFNNTKPTIETTKTILASILANIQTKSKTPKTIIDIVSKYYNITINDIIGKCRKKELVVPRQIVMFLLREECGSSYPTIGDELGGRDHTTAMHAYNKITNNVKEDVKLKQDIDSIKQMLQEECVS